MKIHHVSFSFDLIITIVSTHERGFLPCYGWELEAPLIARAEINSMMVRVGRPVIPFAR
jgi:hypothetical protein